MACLYVSHSRKKSIAKGAPVLRPCSHPSQHYKVHGYVIEVCICHRTRLQKSMKAPLRRV